MPNPNPNRPQYEMMRQGPIAPIPPTLEMSFLLINVLENGYHAQPSNYFRCGYKDGQFNETDANNIAKFLLSHGIFCSATTFPGQPPYLAFTISKVDLVKALDRAFPKDELFNPPSKGCCTIS